MGGSGMNHRRRFEHQTCSGKGQSAQAQLTDFSFSNALPPSGMCKRQPMMSPCMFSTPHRHQRMSHRH